MINSEKEMEEFKPTCRHNDYKRYIEKTYDENMVLTKAVAVVKCNKCRKIRESKINSIFY